MKQHYGHKGKTLRRQAGGYAQAKHFNRLRKTVKRRRTMLRVVMREMQRKLHGNQAAVVACATPVHAPKSRTALGELTMCLQRAQGIRTQQRNAKNRRCALHAPG